MNNPLGPHAEHRDDVEAQEGTSTGITLSPRAAKVTLGAKEKSFGAQGPEMKDTMSFYGVQPALPVSATGNAHQRTLSRGRNRSNSRISKYSSLSRPMSPQSQATVLSQRSAASLPTPKGFYSPQKPAAALRLEQKEKRDMARRQAQAQGGETSAGVVMLSALAISTSTSTHGFNTTRSQSQDQSRSDHAHYRNSDQSMSVEEPGQSEENRYPPPAPIGSSLIDVSSHPHSSQRSSSDLVHRRFDKEKPSAELPIHMKPVKKERERRYKSFENPLTTFFLNGHMVTGGDTWYSAILALVLLFAMTGIWLGTTGVWMWRHGSEYGLAKGGGIAVTIMFVYLFGLTLSSFIASAFRDPGLLPRGLDTDPPLARAQSDSYDLPLDRTFAIGSGSVTVRWCETCRTYRPPRSSHCRMCGNCVDGIDHHCAYIHTCVGRRNYLSFLTLVISATIASIYIVVFSAIHFLLICRHENVPFVNALRSSPGAAVSFLLGCLILPGMLFLLIYHVRLMIFNLTTVEQIRESASKNLIKATKRPANNPFSADSLWRNVLLASLGRPQYPSWINASGWKEIDERRPNPGLVAQSAGTGTGLRTSTGRSRGYNGW